MSEDRRSVSFTIFGPQAPILHPDKPLAEVWYVRLSYRQVTAFVSDVLMNLATVV